MNDISSRSKRFLITILGKIRLWDALKEKKISDRNYVYLYIGYVDNQNTQEKIKKEYVFNSNQEKYKVWKLTLCLFHQI